MTFDRLILGLDDLLRAKEKYPYPPLFQQACNSLAGNLQPYPRTIFGLLKLLEQPLKAWWTFDLPAGFDAGFGLIYDGEVSEEANRYFYEELAERDEKQSTDNSQRTQRNLENRQFTRLMELLQSAGYGNQAQQDYVLLRSFLIENADTTRAVIAATFAGKKSHLHR